MRVDCPECARSLEVAGGVTRIACECGTSLAVEERRELGAFRGGAVVDLRAEESGPPGLVTEEKKLDARVITVRDGVAFTPGALLGGFVGTAVATTLFLLRGGLLQMLVGGAAALAVFLFVRLSVTRRERLIVAKGRLAFLGEGDQRQTIPVE